MTLREPGSYTLIIIRHSTLILFGSLSACATQTVSRAEHLEVLASVRALRAENARLEGRLDKLETDLKSNTRAPVAREAPKAEPARREGQSSGSVEPVPSLTVVKLKPKREAAPRIATEVEVVEPPLASIAVTDVPDEAPDAQENAAIEQLYLQGVDALKTGNTEGGIASLRQFAHDWPKHPRADNALFYAAVGLMAAREFHDAELVLEQAVRQYPAGDATLESMVKLAECKSRLNRQADARATWEKIVASYPGTQAATLAQARLANPVAPQKE